MLHSTEKGMRGAGGIGRANDFRERSARRSTRRKAQVTSIQLSLAGERHKSPRGKEGRREKSRRKLKEGG